MSRNKGKCSAALVSMTQAIKAQRLLASAAIPSDVIKLDSGAAMRGCTYGIEFACGQLNNVKTVLANSGMVVKRWNTGD